MPLINCPDCGKEISDQAPACPNCGRPVTAKNIQSAATDKPVEKKNYSAILAIVFIVALVGGAVIYGQFFKKTEAEKAAESLGVTVDELKGAYDRFNQPTKEDLTRLGIACDSVVDQKDHLRDENKCPNPEARYYCPIYNDCRSISGKLPGDSDDTRCLGQVWLCQATGKRYFITAGKNQAVEIE